ncbi:hypothetical protein WN55_09097 [Dufourea novaeangliae]|uniref:Uncharacterized protein n=1 Tax=Dufourea novaeangliae TaxID=178035 RepID=A0A154P9G1_DUFNO|nr:hypothetical protein WN55_09097 [Dufourea novaeangliae]
MARGHSRTKQSRKFKIHIDGGALAFSDSRGFERGQGSRGLARSNGDYFRFGSDRIES